MTASTKIRSFILTIAAIAVFVAGYFAYDHIRNLNLKASEEVALWKEDQGRKEELAMLEKKIAAIRANDSALQSMFLSEENTVRFFDTLETLADELGATTTISSLRKLSAGTIGTSTVERVAMTVTVEGDWQALYNYLALLEVLPYASRLDAVTLAAVKRSNLGESSKLGQQWIADISLSVLKYK